MARWSRGSVLLGAAAGGLAAVVLAVALTRPDGSSAIAQAAASPGVSSNPDDFVKVVNHKLTLHGRPFIAKGTNYFGSWRFPMTLRLNDGVRARDHLVVFSPLGRAQARPRFQIPEGAAERDGVAGRDPRAGRFRAPRQISWL